MNRLKSACKRKPWSERLFDGVVLLILFTLLIIFPFPNLLSISLSSEAAIMAGRVKFWPAGFSLASYRQVLETSVILRAYGNTLFVAAAGCAGSLLCTSLAAYPLAYGDFAGKKAFKAP